MSPVAHRQTGMTWNRRPQVPNHYRTSRLGVTSVAASQSAVPAALVVVLGPHHIRHSSQALDPHQAQRQQAQRQQAQRQQAQRQQAQRRQAQRRQAQRRQARRQH